MSGSSESTGAGPSKPPAPTVEEIEAQIVARRQLLARNVDELLYEVQPQVILGRQRARAKRKIRGLTRTPDGQLRTERIAGVLGATAVFLVGIGLLRRGAG